MTSFLEDRKVNVESNGMKISKVNYAVKVARKQVYYLQRYGTLP